MEFVTSLAKASASAVTRISEVVMKKRQIQTMIRAAEEEIPTGDVEKFLGGLSPSQISAISRFASSLQFEHIALQKIINQISGNKEDVNFDIRSQIKSGLRCEEHFEAADLIQAADFLEVNLARSCVAAMSSVADFIDANTALSAAAEVAAAGVQNSKFLENIENLYEINKFSDLLRKQMVKRYSSVRVANVVRNATAIDYKGLYVAPNFTGGEDVFSDSSAAEENNVALEYILSRHSRFVIVGDPGAGKSTLSAKLVHDIAKNRFRSLQGLTPLLLIVREHTKDIRHSHRLLIDYLEDSCRKPHNLQPPEKAVEYLLRSGRAVVVIDGVDELGDSHFRESFRDVIESFRSLYPLTRIIVTSRSVGYLEAPLDQVLFPAFRILPFDGDQVEDYAKKWFKFVGSTSGLHKEQQENLTSDFLIESAEGARDLRSNPLMLSLVCALYSSSGFIPANKAQIYEKCAEILFETWDKSRGIENAFNWQSSIRTSVLRLAWHVMNDTEGRQVFPKSEMKRYLGSTVFAERYELEDDAMQAAEEFLEFCAGRAWVLTDMGSDVFEPQYGFVHRTFLEYFAASQLVKLDPNPEAVWRKIKNRCNDSSWQIICQLAIQILDRANDRGAGKLLSLLMDELNITQDQAQRDSYLNIATRSFNLVSPGYAEIKRITFEAVDRAMAVPVSRRIILGEISHAPPRSEDTALVTLLRCRSSDNCDQVSQYILERIEFHLESEETKSRAELLSFAIKRNMIHQQGKVQSAIEEKLKSSSDAINDSAEKWNSRFCGRGDLRSSREVELLYSAFSFGNTIMWSEAHVVVSYFIFGRVFGSDEIRSAIESRLEGMYDLLVRFGPLGRFKVGSFDAGIARRLSFDGAFTRDSLMMQVSPRARASVLLLALPLFANPKFRKNVVSPEFRHIKSIAGRGNPSEASVKIVDSWDLPPEVHGIVVHWIHYGSFADRNLIF